MERHNDSPGDILLRELFDDPEFAKGYADANWQAALVDQLVLLRVESGQSQKDVAAAMGTSQSSVSTLETASNDPRLSTLLRYARAVGAHIEALVRPAEPMCTSTCVGSPSAVRTYAVHGVASGVTAGGENSGRWDFGQWNSIDLAPVGGSTSRTTSQSDVRPSKVGLYLVRSDAA